MWDNQVLVFDPDPRHRPDGGRALRLRLLHRAARDQSGESGQCRHNHAVGQPQRCHWQSRLGGKYQECIKMCDEWSEDKVAAFLGLS